MAFTGWENAKPGEEFSVDEITAFYGSIGPYSLLERPKRSLWGRCPLVAKCIVKDGIPGKFEAGARVLAFLRQEGTNCTVAAFPETLFKTDESTRSVIASAEMRSLKDAPLGGPWTMRHNAQLFIQPYTPELRELTPPYAPGDMEGVFKKLAEKHGSFGDFALASELFATGTEDFPHFAFALARTGAEDSRGKIYEPWDVVLIFFGKAPGNAVLAVPLRAAAFWDQEKLAEFAAALARQSASMNK